MRSQVIVVILLLVSMINIFWSTLLQKKIPWSNVDRMKQKWGLRAYFIHADHPGAVCWFGIFSGILILAFTIIQLSLVIHFYQTEDHDSLYSLMVASLVIACIILLLMSLMNSGLLINSAVFLICQIVASLVVIVKNGQ